MKGFAVGLILKVRGFGGRSGIFHTTLMLPDPVQRATAKWPILCNNRVGQPKAPNDNHCHEILVRLQIPKVLSARHAVVVVFFYVLSYNFQVCVCDMPMVFNCRHLLCIQDR